MTIILLLLILSLITLSAAAAGATLREINLTALGLAFFVASMLAGLI